jgi:predicted ATPase/DNA-binding CsgD family transcriptional regulator/tetratricopeptide (TPR) repeat protein
MNRRAHGNLGEEPNSFIGRERELDEMRKLAASARALTLCGAGGIGKTRLAVRVLAELADDFPDGVWFVELADLRQPDLVVSRISSVIGVAEEPGRPLLDTLADALRPRRVLLGLDNCEQLIEACARVCQRLLASAPGLRVIATSREPLRVAAETVWQVPPLSLPAAEDTSDAAVYLEEPAGSDAIRLFEDRAAAAMPGFVLTPANMASAVQICRALDGLPLAIELAATWVRVLSVEQIAARLDDRFQLLTSGDRTAPPRQRTLRAAIDWSHDLLTPAEQVMLRRLSVFAGWTLEMAERVCADDTLPAGEILDLLSALTDKSLVMVEAEALSQTRYRMLDTIRGYAASRLAEAGETAKLHNRLRDYTVAVAERSMVVGMALVRAPWSARVDVFRRFDVDADNMGQVLSRCLADRDAETGLRICTAVRPCWIVRGLFAEGSEWLDMFLALDVPAVPDAVRGRALVGRAQLVLASDPVRAEADAMAGLELCWAAGEEFWTAGALNVLTETALHAGKIDVAVQRADEALTVARNAGDRWNEAYALGTRAAAAAGRGGLREAQELGEAALAIMEDIDQQWGAARTLLGLGDLARMTGDAGIAQERYLAALVILREVSARPEIARCLAGLGRIAMEQKDMELARQRLTESLELSASTGSRIGVIRGLDGFAALAILEDRPDRGVQLAAAAAALRGAAGLPAARGARTQCVLDAAADLGDQVIGRLWTAGSALSGSDAVVLAFDGPARPSAPGTRRPGTRQEEGDRDGGGQAPGDVTAASGGARGHGHQGAGTPGSPVPAGAQSPPGRLTRREEEIVALITRGASNKGIASELFISPATAARHVANILAKLGFTSRAQVAAWAQRGGGVNGRRKER